MTTNYPKGLTNNTAQNILGNLKTVDPTLYHAYFEDFDEYHAVNWTVTETGAATQALTNADGGVLLVTNAAADDDASFSQKTITMKDGMKMNNHKWLTNDEVKLKQENQNAFKFLNNN